MLYLKHAVLWDVRFDLAAWHLPVHLIVGNETYFALAARLRKHLSSKAGGSCPHIRPHAFVDANIHATFGRIQIHSLIGLLTPMHRLLGKQGRHAGVGEEGWDGAHQ